jgi:hypothetical protein
MEITMSQFSRTRIVLPKVRNNTKECSAKQDRSQGALIRGERKVDDLGGEEQKLESAAYAKSEKATTIHGCISPLRFDKKKSVGSFNILQKVEIS